MATWPSSIATIALLVSTSVAFGSVEFTLLKDKQKLTGGEICFFPASAEFGDEGFRSNYFRSGEVRCMSADLLVHMPTGRFLFYGEHPDGFVSFVARIGNRAPHGPDQHQEVGVPVHTAGRLNCKNLLPLIPAGAYVGAVVYHPRITYFVPLAKNRESISVPSGYPVIPIVVAKHGAIRTGNPLKVAPGEVVDVLSVMGSVQRRSLVCEVSVQPDLILPTKPTVGFQSPYLGAFQRIEPPVIVARLDSKVTLTPAVPLSEASQAISTLIVFNDVPRNVQGEVSIAGPHWENHAIPVSLGDDGAVTVAVETLYAVPAGVINVKWDKQLCSAELSFALRTCDKCSAVRTIVVGVEECSGLLSIKSVALGEYVVEMVARNKKVRDRVVVKPGADVDVTLDP